SVSPDRIRLLLVPEELDGAEDGAKECCVVPKEYLLANMIEHSVELLLAWAHDLLQSWKSMRKHEFLGSSRNLSFFVEPVARGVIIQILPVHIFSSAVCS